MKHMYPNLTSKTEPYRKVNTCESLHRISETVALARVQTTAALFVLARPTVGTCRRVNKMYIRVQSIKGASRVVGNWHMVTGPV